MKKLKLKALELGASELLTREQLKNVMAGDGSGGGIGTGCANDNLGLCGGNCQTPHGAASKCSTNSSSKCTCGGL